VTHCEDIGPERAGRVESEQKEGMEGVEECEREFDQEHRIEQTPRHTSREFIGTLNRVRCVRTSDGKTMRTRGMQNAQRTEE